jgi:hypothetical protein
MSVTMFRANGPVHVEHYPKTASTDFTFNEPVALDTTGTLIPYTPGIAAPFLGLVKKTIASTDSDYATATRVPVEVGNYDTEYLITASTTGALATDVGEEVDYVEATISVNVGSSSVDDFFVTQVLSSTLVVGKFTRRVTSQNLNTAFV